MERRQRRWRARWSSDRMIRRFDVDKDRKVTRDEFETRVADMFKRADLDGDGKIADLNLPPIMRDRGVLSGNGEMRRRGRRRDAPDTGPVLGQPRAGAPSATPAG